MSDGNIPVSTSQEIETKKVNINHLLFAPDVNSHFR